MNVDDLAAARRTVVVDRGAARGDADVLPPEDRLDHVGRARGALAEAAVAGGDAQRLGQELADRIAQPPYNWTPDIIWNAYVALDPQYGAKSDHHTLTDLVSLVRFTVGVDDRLVPYVERVKERYAAWLAQFHHYAQAAPQRGRPAPDLVVVYHAQGERP